MTRQIVERARNYESDTVPGDYATLVTPCPKCGGIVKENYKRFACTNCDFSITKIPGGRQFELPEVETLLKEKVIGPLSGFRSKMGRPFSAILKVTDEHKLEFDFGQSNEDDENAEPVDFGDQQPLGPCPRCDGRVFAHGMSYVCENSVGPGKRCDFRSGREILQQPIEPEQMSKLLAQGKTDLFTGFVSSRTRRKFKAFLVKQPDGKISFEFDNSKARPGKGAKAGAAAGSEPAQPASAGAGSGAREGLAADATAARTRGRKPATVTAAVPAKATARKRAAVPATKRAAAKKPGAKKPAAKRPATGKAKAPKPAASKPGSAAAATVTAKKSA